MSSFFPIHFNMTGLIVTFVILGSSLYRGRCVGVSLFYNL